MSTCRNSINCEITKITRSRASWRIENFTSRMSQMHVEQFSIPGLANWRIEVTPNHLLKTDARTCGRRFTKLQFTIDCPERRKKRLIRVEVKTKIDICIWIEDFFDYEGRVEKVKEEFINQVFLNSYLVDGALALEALIVVKEYDCFSDLGSTILTRQDKILSDISGLYGDLQLSDFKFIVEGQEFPIHKNILAARSPVFLKMFTGNFQEKNGKQQEVLDASKEAFGELMRFIYTGEIQDLEKNVEELLALADRYEVSDLQKVCELKLMANLKDENAESIFQLAHQHQCNGELKQAAFSMLQSLFSKFNCSMPSEFIEKPEKVHRAIEAKNALESVLTNEPIMAAEIVETQPETEDATVCALEMLQL